MKLSGWGRYPVIDCRVLHAREELDVVHAVKSNPSLIARGNGRSYGDAALNPAATLSMLKMNRFLAFDEVSGVLECQAGVLLSEVLDIFVPKGWFPPVMPGTKFVTIGGMIAADVHGKNHQRNGSFGRFVQSLRLVTADGVVKTCSREQNPDLFRATIGGMGLMGVITSARFALKRIETAFIRMTIQRCRKIDNILQLFEEHQAAEYSVAWIDCSGREGDSWRGIHFTGTHVQVRGLPGEFKSSPLSLPKRRKLNVPVTMPFCPFNPSTIKVLNSIYYRRTKCQDRIVDYERFFHPLDAVGNWNRLYGLRGLLQFQCVIPKAKGRDAILAIFERVAQSGQGSPLAILKALGPSEGMLSFPMAGYTLAMDFPVNPTTLSLQTDLTQLASKSDGRLYYAKNAVAAPQGVSSGYEVSQFNELRETSGAAARFNSVLSARAAL